MSVSTKDAMAFVRQILAGNFDAAGVFADWLEEQDCPNARNRGKLLRRRWKQYQRERGEEIAEAKRREEEIVTPLQTALNALKKASWDVSGSVCRARVEPAELAQLRFRRYVQKHFPFPEFKYLEGR